MLDAVLRTGKLQIASTRMWAVPREVDTGFHVAMGISVVL